MRASCVFYFYFPNPLRSFGTERCLSPKGISLALSYSFLRTPLTPSRNENDVNSVSWRNPLQPPYTNTRGGMGRRSKEEEGKGSGDETHRSCQFLGQAQRNQEKPQPETGGRVNNMGSLGSGVLRLPIDPRPLFAACPNFLCNDRSTSIVPVRQSSPE